MKYDLPFNLAVSMGKVTGPAIIKVSGIASVADINCFAGFHAYLINK